jgi:hypothetical protein
MLWVVLATMLVTILRFTLTPTTAVVCFRWVLPVVVLYIHHSTVLLIVPVTASVVVPIFELIPHCWKESTRPSPLVPVI